jgi:hypothetical protein
MATFIQRCVQEGDFETDGGAIDLNFLKSVTNLCDYGLLTRAEFKTILNCTVAQANECDEIFAAAPAPVLDKARWAEAVVAVMYAGSQHWVGFETASACRVKLGLSA